MLPPFQLVHGGQLVRQQLKRLRSSLRREPWTSFSPPPSPCPRTPSCGVLAGGFSRLWWRLGKPWWPRFWVEHATVPVRKVSLAQVVLTRSLPSSQVIRLSLWCSKFKTLVISDIFWIALLALPQQFIPLMGQKSLVFLQRLYLVHLLQLVTHFL